MSDVSEQTAKELPGLLAAYRALRTLLRFIDEHEDDGWQFPVDPGCRDCTAGVTPDRYHTGLCPRHAAARRL